jgi:hypothetical protein
MSAINENTREQIAHSIDYIGQTFGLYRFKDESLAEFRKRVYDVFTHKASLSLIGNINTISRDLGKPVSTLCSLKKKRLEGILVNPNAAISITPLSIQFYSDYQEGILEKEFFTVLPLGSDHHDTMWYVDEFREYILASTDWEFGLTIATDDRWRLLKYALPVNSFYKELPLQIRTGIGYLDTYLNYNESTIKGGQGYLTNSQLNASLVIEKGDYFLDESKCILYTPEQEEIKTFSFFIDCSLEEVFIEIAPIEFRSLSSPEYRRLFLQRIKAEDNIGTEEIYLMDTWLLYAIEAMKQDKTFWIADDTNKSSVDVYGKYTVSDALLDEVESFYFSKENENFRTLLGLNVSS